MRWVSLGLTVLLWGCGTRTPTPETKPVAPGAAPVSQPSGESKSDADAAAIPVMVDLNEDTAAAAVVRTLRAIEQGNLAAAYEFLPPGYQADVDGLVHEFADRMDAEVWTKLFATLRKGVEVLRTKKDFILALDLFQNRSASESLRRHWDEAVALLTAFTTSDAADLSALKQVRAKSLLPGESSSVLRQLDAMGLAVGASLARQFEGVSVQPVRADGEEHVLAFRGPRDTEPTEIVYIKHDGRWLPKSLVEQWPAGIEADRAWLAKLPEQIKTVKPRLLEALLQADGILDQLLAAQNREEFEQAAGPAVLTLALAWPRLQQLAQQSTSGQSDRRPLTISIDRELVESEQTKLIDVVFKPLQAAGTDYTLVANDGRTICRLSHVADIDSLRESLAKHFSLAPTGVSIDRDASRIEIKLSP